MRVTEGEIRLDHRDHHHRDCCRGAGSFRENSLDSRHRVLESAEKALGPLRRIENNQCHTSDDPAMNLRLADLERSRVSHRISKERALKGALPYMRDRL